MLTTPSGAFNGSNQDFTLPQPPGESGMLLFLNGVTQLIGVDFTVTDATVHYAVAPASDDWHFAELIADGTVGLPPSGGNLFWRTILLRNLTIGNDVCDNEAIYLNRKLTSIYGWLREPITANLSIVIHVYVAGSAHTVGTFTIPLTDSVRVVREWKLFSWTSFPDKSIVTVDIMASDGSFNANGVAAFTLIFDGAANGGAGNYVY